MDQVQQHNDQLELERASIERETRVDAESILDRLQMAAGRKAAILANDASMLRDDLESIDQFHQRVSILKATPREMHTFLQHSSETWQAAQVLASKPFKTELDVVLDDLPRETASRRALLEKTAEMQDIIHIKDQMVWFLLRQRQSWQQRQKEQDSQVEQLDQATQQEMTKWIELTDRFAVELQDFKMSCRYCGTRLNGDSVNSYCPDNGSPSTVQVEGPYGQPGSGLHYFERV